METGGLARLDGLVPFGDVGRPYRAHVEVAPLTDHLLLVDCSAFAYRSFYSQPAMRRMDSGEPTGAVLGFMSLLWRMLGAASADQPTHAAAVFDAPGKNFRHTIFSAYKGNRDPARSIELEKQLPLMRPVAEVLGLTPIEADGFEADDVIATLADRAHRAGIRSTIVSSDKDFGQLVVDGWIEIVDPMQRARDPTKSPRRLEADIVAKFGVPPAQVPDVQALAGDSVDNIPGMRGCGLETAARLVRRFGSLEGVLDGVNEVRFHGVRADLKRHMELHIDSRGRARLHVARGGNGKTGADWARHFLQLTTLRRDVPLDVEIADMPQRPIMMRDLTEIVKALNPSANVTALFGIDLQDVRVVPRLEDPLEWWREELLAPGQSLPAIPACGYYITTLVKGGAPVPARIWREPQMDPALGTETGFDLLRCEVDGRAKDPLALFNRLSMNPIRITAFQYMVDDSAHAKAYRPDDPKADPTQAPDILKMPARHSQSAQKGK